MKYVLAILLLATLACSGKKEEETGPVVTVDVAPVLLKKIDRTIRADGLLYPRQQAAIVPKITAPIKKWYVQRGSRVRAGQLLVELENRDLQGAAEGRARCESGAGCRQRSAIGLRQPAAVVS
jgi:multidrug efflux pump subunit AcrA (membrane-fusion protein)